MKLRLPALEDCFAHSKSILQLVPRAGKLLSCELTDHAMQQPEACLQLGYVRICCYAQLSVSSHELLQPLLHGAKVLWTTRGVSIRRSQFRHQFVERLWN